MFWICVDLDELVRLDRGGILFGHNRASLVSLSDADYAGPGPGSIREKITRRLVSDGVLEPLARIALLTLPRVCGYVFNPVSFYLCYRPDETLAAIVAEVHNTFGETHHYVLQPESRDRGSDEATRFRAAKMFYVSPFLEMSGEYEILLIERADFISIEVHLEQHGRRVFSATMRGMGTPFSAKRLTATLCQLPLLAATVMLRIHWQALRLYVGKRLPMYSRDGLRSHERTARSFWHRLRERAVARARKPPSNPATMKPLTTLENE